VAKPHKHTQSNTQPRKEQNGDWGRDGRMVSLTLVPDRVQRQVERVDRHTTARVRRGRVGCVVGVEGKGERRE
jgi:hypothetical protein